MKGKGRRTSGSQVEISLKAGVTHSAHFAALGRGSPDFPVRDPDAGWNGWIPGMAPHHRWIAGTIRFGWCPSVITFGRRN